METVYVGARIEQELKDLVEKVCKARGEDVSDFIRRSIRKELASLSFLPAEDKKALGIKQEASQ
jgi:antitoxin component of RelBE/YafQ-DinJ toxin-antitoxin module